MKAKALQQLMIAKSFIAEDYERYVRNIPLRQQLYLSWLDKDYLISLVLIPNLPMDSCTDNALKRIYGASQVVQFTYLAQQVHNQVPPVGEKEDYQYPILIGDYLFAKAYEAMVKNDLSTWLDALGDVICRMNEARNGKLKWSERGFVPLEERLEEINGEYAHLPALAGLIGATLAGLEGEAKEAMAGFGYYSGIMQGLIKEKLNLKPNYLENCESYLAMLPAKLAADLRLLVLEPLLNCFGMPKSNTVSKSL